MAQRDEAQTLTTVELMTLAAIGDRPRYGYQLVERIEALSAGAVRIRPGNLYRVLHRLESRGLIGEVEDVRGEEDHTRRQYFEATAEGRALAARQLDMYARILDDAPELKAALGDA